jgi:hypothetical protein
LFATTNALMLLMAVPGIKSSRDRIAATDFTSQPTIQKLNDDLQICISVKS